MNSLLEERLSVLESLELSMDGLSSVDYMEMLSLYLLGEDLIQFELLWQRIPTHIISSCNAFNQVKDVYYAINSLNYGEISSLIDNADFQGPCKENMLKLKLDSQFNALKLAATVYSCIEKQSLANMIGVNVDGLTNLLQEDKSTTWKFSECGNYLTGTQNISETTPEPQQSIGQSLAWLVNDISSFKT